MDTAGLRLELPALGPSRMMILRLSAQVGGKLVATNQVDIALYRRPEAEGFPTISAPEALHPWLTALGLTLSAPDKAGLVLAHVLAPP